MQVQGAQGAIRVVAEGAEGIKDAAGAALEGAQAAGEIAGETASALAQRVPGACVAAAGTRASLRQGASWLYILYFTLPWK